MDKGHKFIKLNNFEESAMAESKSQDKFFPYTLKQEGFDSFNWAPVESDFENFRNSNSFLIDKINNRGQLFGDFNPLSINPDLNNDPGSMTIPPENPNIVTDQTDPSARINSNYPLFNEKLLTNSNHASEVGINSMKPPYSSLVMNSVNKLQTYPGPNNYYFPFNNNNLRRPLPQELLEEEPVYVNPKQYERIMKLRIKKARKGMLKTSVMPLERPKDSFKHLSRHLHAKRRERGTGGRFLSKEAQKKKQEEEDNDLEGLGLGSLEGNDDFDTIRKHSVDDE